MPFFKIDVSDDCQKVFITDTLNAEEGASSLEAFLLLASNFKFNKKK